MAGNAKLELEGEPRSLGKDFKELLNNNEFSDVKFVIGENKVVFNAHKCILSARCETMKEMLQEVDNVPIVFPELNADVFESILDFIYTNKCMVLQTDVAQLLSTSLELSILELVKVCGRHIEDNISLETACPAMQAAVTFGLDSFKRSLLRFFRDHARDIFHSEGFHELSDETLAYILQDDELKMDEYDIVKAVENWTLVNSLPGYSEPIDTLVRGHQKHFIVHWTE